MTRDAWRCVVLRAWCAVVVGRCTSARRAVACACLTVVLIASRVDAGPPKIVRSAEFLRSVEAAIDRGVAWLRTQETADGWVDSAESEAGGMCGARTALVLHALQVCGVPREDPLVRRNLAALRAAYERQKRPDVRQTYTVALMCLAAAAEPPADASARTSDRPAWTKADLDWLRDMAAWLELAMSEDGAWSYGRHGTPDHSNTQYALLGLRAAARAGVSVSPKTWRTALEHLLDAQEPATADAARAAPPSPPHGADAPGAGARGWTYRPQQEARNTMTAGCLASVVICADALRLPRDAVVTRRVRDSVEDGLAWLAAHWPVSDTPAGEGGRFYYYLHALERAAVLADVERVGPHDWYGDGARCLVRNQWPSGAWAMASTPRPAAASAAEDPGRAFAGAGVDTCWALLFLRRGTAPAAAAAATPATDESNLDFAAAAKLADRELPEFVDLVLSRWRLGREPAREELLARATALGPRILETCVLRLAAPDADVRHAARALLTRATGLDAGPDPGASPTARAAVLDRWASWLAAHRNRLRYDAEAGRIVGADEERR